MPIRSRTRASLPPVDPRHNVGGWVDAHARSRPDACALSFQGFEPSYGELARRIARLSGGFAEAGVGPGDRVGLLLENGPGYLEAVLAAARIGAIALPINLRLTAAEIRYILADASPRLVLVSAAHEEKLERSIEGLDGLEEERPTIWIVTHENDHPGGELAPGESRPIEAVRAVSPEDPMLLMYTSGTTGSPKGALLPHRKALANCLNAEFAFRIRRDDRGLVAAPLFHSLGLQILCLPLIFKGACVVLHERFDAEAVVRCIEAERISYFGGVPTYYQRIRELLDAQPDRYDLSSLRLLFTAGAAAPASLIEDFGRLGTPLCQGYGQTETSLICCIEPKDALRKPGSVGRALPHSEIRVITPATLARPPEEWRDAAAGDVGEIVVRGATTMLGYWRQDDATAATLREGWVLTGDLARIDDEGFVRLDGRSKEMFISGGENVYPAEVESAYARHPAIREIAVLGSADPEWGEVGAAYVVLEPGHRLVVEEFSDWGREVLAAYKIPRFFYALDSLPRTASGKVRKHLLEAQRGE